jgi:hypothetical protein
MTRRTLPALALALAAMLALAGCGGGGGGSAPPAGDLATAVPPSAPVFAEGAVRPQGSLRTALESSLSKLLGTRDPGAKVVALFDRSNRDTHITYEQDIKPWLGERAGFFVQSFDAEPVAVAQTTNPKTASDSLRKAAIADGHTPHSESYRGVTVEEAGTDSFTTIGGLVATGGLSGVEAAIDASKGSSLADSHAYTSSVADVPSDNVFEAWANPPRIVNELVNEGQLPGSAPRQLRSQLGSLVKEPVVVWGDASPSYLAIEASGASSPGGVSQQSSSLLGSLPGDSWFAFGVHETAEQIKRSFGETNAAARLGARGSAALLRGLSQLGLDPATLSRWVGDVSGFLRGTSILGLGGALVVGTRDPAASAHTLARVEAALRRDRDLVVQALGGGQTGFTMTPRGAPIQVVFTQRSGKVVIGLGQDSVNAALNPPRSLSSSAAFKGASGALGSGISPELYLDFQPIASLLGIPGVITDPQFEQVKPYLARLDYLVAGTGESDGRSLVRIELGVRSGGGSGSGSMSAAGLPRYAAIAP